MALPYEFQVNMQEEIGSTPALESQPRAAWWQGWWVQARRIGLFVGVVVAALVGVLLYNALFPDPVPLTQNDVDNRVVAVMASATPPPANSALVYQFILPSLVYIQTQNIDAEGEEGVGVGSGVVVNESGDILTANHVVDGATGIEVIFADGTHATAVILNTDPENDIAVLHPSRPPEVIVPAVLSSAGAMRVGDQAYAVGNPLGLAGSMSAGVISGFDRSLPVDDDLRLEGLIQFDAAVNPGNSGGPLLNRAGQVVGIVTALVNPNEQNSFTGIGFAVPIGTAVSAAGAPDY